MADNLSTDKASLLKHFAEGNVPSEEDFSALINQANGAASLLGLDKTGDINADTNEGKPLAGLQVKGGKLSVATDPEGPVTLDGEKLVLKYNPAHFSLDNDGKIIIRVAAKKGLSAEPTGLAVKTGKGIGFSQKGQLAVKHDGSLRLNGQTLEVSAGKGLTTADGTLSLLTEEHKGLIFDKEGNLAVQVNNDGFLTVGADGLTISEDAIKRFGENNPARFKKALGWAWAKYFPGTGVVPESYFWEIEVALKHLAEKKWKPADIVSGSMLTAPENMKNAADNRFKLHKPDGSVMEADNGAAYIFKHSGEHHQRYSELWQGFSIAVGSVDNNGNYSQSANKITQNALLMFGFPNDACVLGWWDLSQSVTNGFIAPQLEKGWHPLLPVMISPGAWEAPLSVIYNAGAGHQADIAKLRAYTEKTIATSKHAFNQPPVVSLGLVQQGNDIILRTSYGQRAMSSDPIYVYGIKNGEIAPKNANNEYKSLDQWEEDCWVIFAETNDAGDLAAWQNRLSKNALVVLIGGKDATGKARYVSVLGSFELTGKGTVGAWQYYTGLSSGATVVEARHGLELRLKTLLANAAVPNKPVRINISASEEEEVSSFYYGKGKTYPPASLVIIRLDAAGIQPLIKPVKDWPDGWYAVAARLKTGGAEPESSAVTITDDGKLPADGKTLLTDNAVMIGKFGNVVSVVGYWILTAEKKPAWSPSLIKDPVLG